MPTTGACNPERLQLYYDTFRDIVQGHNDENVDVENTRANLLIDTRWPEVSRALACNLIELGSQSDIRPLAADVERLVGRAAVLAFGTRNHAEIPSWFLQNCECLVASTLHKLLVRFVNTPRPERVMRRAFGALLDVAEGVRSYVGLRYLAASTGAHVLMSAVVNAKYDFLVKHAECVHDSEMVLAHVLATRLLADSNRAMEAQSAFCFFARSERWCSFAEACLHGSLPDGRLARLLREVDAAKKWVADAHAHAHAQAQAQPHPSASPTRPTRAVSTRTPSKPRRSVLIAKRVTPLMRRVVNGCSISPLMRA
jgi:hypothetical protein